jgi:hypothetical protein
MKSEQSVAHNRLGNRSRDVAGKHTFSPTHIMCNRSDFLPSPVTPEKNAVGAVRFILGSGEPVVENGRHFV